MGEQAKLDPLEGFHFDDFDEETKTLTVRIHKMILAHPKQKEALLAKLAEVLAFGDSIDKIVVATRD
jgi:hypothetical protein